MERSIRFERELGRKKRVEPFARELHLPGRRNIPAKHSDVLGQVANGRPLPVTIADAIAMKGVLLAVRINSPSSVSSVCSTCTSNTPNFGTITLE